MNTRYLNSIKTIFIVKINNIKSTRTRGFWIIFFTGFAIRLFLSLIQVEVADTANYRIVAQTLQNGGRLYTDTPGIYPYPPPWALWEVIALWLSQHSPIPFLLGVEFPSICADMGIVWLLSVFASHYGKRLTQVAALYALNPLPIIICTVHGQFDAIPILCSLLAVWYFQERQSFGRSACALLFGIATKSFPVLFVPFFIMRLPTWKQREKFAAIIIIPMLLLLLPFFLLDTTSIVRELFGYMGVPDQGWGAVIRKLSSAEELSPNGHTPIQNFVLFSKYPFLLAYGIFFLIFCYKTRQVKRVSFIPVFVTVFALFYGIYGGISSQYLVWILPFLILYNTRLAVIYSWLAFLSVFFFYAAAIPLMLYPIIHVIFPFEIAYIGWLFLPAFWWLFELFILNKMRKHYRSATLYGNKTTKVIDTRSAESDILPNSLIK